MPLYPEYACSHVAGHDCERAYSAYAYMYIIVNNCIYFFLFVKRLELLDMCAIEIEDIIILLCLGDGGWGVNIHNLRFINFNLAH
jgi:hypothetical protein